ncbi:MAG: hypothetical protein RL189_847 [Pseudomonadota bacterium]|jgi:hypothetical protein
MAFIIVRRILRLIAGLASIVSASCANASEPVLPEEVSLLERSRAAVASELQLMSADLLDEFVFGLKVNPIFATRSNVVLGGVNVPYGFGAGMTAYLENHFAELILKNPETRMELVHCPECSAVVAHSGPRATVMGRGLRLNEVLSSAGIGTIAKYAVFMDIEAEKSQLVLRGRITEIRENLPIVYARTISTSTTSPVLLRSSANLKSASEARQEYLDVLRNSPFFSFPIRVGVHNYAQYSPQATDPWVERAAGGGLLIPPLVWFIVGAETSFSQSRVWTAEFNLGITNQIDSHDGWLAGGRFSRLISGRMRSLTEPDLYLVLGGAVTSLRGNTAASFRKNSLNVAEIIAKRTGAQPRASFSSFRLALEARVKNRVSLSAFLESMPAFSGSSNFGTYLDAGLQFQSAGMEVGFWF